MQRLLLIKFLTFLVHVFAFQLKRSESWSRQMNWWCPEPRCHHSLHNIEENPATAPGWATDGIFCHSYNLKECHRFLNSLPLSYCNVSTIGWCNSSLELIRDLWRFLINYFMSLIVQVIIILLSELSLNLIMTSMFFTMIQQLVIVF